VNPSFYWSAVEQTSALRARSRATLIINTKLLYYLNGGLFPIFRRRSSDIIKLIFIETERSILNEFLTFSRIRNSPII
jgi:hypothetical protein